MRNKASQFKIWKLSLLFALSLLAFSACKSEKTEVEGFDISFLKEESQFPNIVLNITASKEVENLKKKELILTENGEEVEIKVFRKKGTKYYLTYESTLPEDEEIELRLEYDSKNFYWGEIKINPNLSASIEQKEKDDLKKNQNAQKDEKIEKIEREKSSKQSKENNEDTVGEEPKLNSKESKNKMHKEPTLEEKYANFPEKNLVSKNNVIDISASSVFPNMKRKSGEIVNYSPLNVLDRNIKTVWAEGNKNSLGAGEYLELKFKEAVISKIRIFNGYGETRNNLFNENNRATKATVTIGDYVESFVLDPNLFDYQVLTLSKLVQGDYIRITFDEIYDENVDELCISELEVIGFEL